MPKTILPFSSPDISALARSLRNQIAAAGSPPGHVQLLNMLARATGHRNFQHFRAWSANREAADTPPDVDLALVDAVTRHFDASGALLRWPARKRHQQLALWVLWSAFPARRELAEREVNALLQAQNRFGDHALLRRAMWAAGLLFRTTDGSIYRRIERQPPDEAIVLIGRLRTGGR
jgi:hypothetical protein